ncbi:DUF4834 family protein [Flavobacterium caeni]|uniref:DUF4834 domain-containing protein n=1 Tax=Flavobacterium caeni TaxID=490189 RepID=A0A1G5IXE9_9FLAO|nr:DUF4834 family protein [Flavobacterium caeni]SCY80697.1 protein of unknown function [Flavobacterium caeni]
MDHASFSGTIKVIFYIILFYYVFKFLARLFFPVLVKKAVEKAAQNFEQQQRQYQGYQSTRTANNDEIIYDSNVKSSKPRETKKVGEYIDFEEIK